MHIWRSSLSTPCLFWLPTWGKPPGNVDVTRTSTPVPVTSGARNKMASVGGMGEENSVQEGQDSPEKALSTINEMCKRNGINHACHCAKKSCKLVDGKRTKTVQILKINGVSKNTIRPSIPTLRSRRNITLSERRTLLPESPRRKRRLSKSDRQEDVDR